MAGLLNSADTYALTGAFYSHFLTFSKAITLYKAPTLAVNNGGNIYGYLNQENNLAPSQVTHSFSGLRFYPKPKYQALPDLKTTVDQHQSYIKVLQPASQLINFGPNDKIEIDGQDFGIQSSTMRIQDYLGLKFYIYDLERIQ